MSEYTLYKNLVNIYKEISTALKNAKRASLEYEVYISDMEHKMGKGKVVKNVDKYFLNLMSKKDAKSSNN